MAKNYESAIVIYLENYSEIKTELHELRHSRLLLWRFRSWPSIQGSSTFRNSLQGVFKTSQSQDPIPATTPRL